MRLLEMLTTDELKRSIKVKISELKDIKNVGDIRFEKNIKNGEDGTYIFADEQGYHYVQMERGKEQRHKVTDDVFEICFWCLYDLICIASFNYEFENRKENINSREAAFNKQLEYLSLLGDNFKKRGEIEISEILKAHPL